MLSYLIQEPYHESIMLVDICHQQSAHVYHWISLTLIWALAVTQTAHDGF